MKYVLKLLCLTQIIVINLSMGQRIEFDHPIEQVDKILSNSRFIDLSFIDSSLIQYPNSAYLIGMKGYALVQHNNIKEAKSFIEDKLKLFPNLIKNTYFLTAIASLEIANNKEKGETHLLIALKKDQLKKNQWVRFELFKAIIERNQFQAWSYLEESINIAPYFSPALVQKSYLLDQIDNCREIIKILEAVQNFGFEDDGMLTYLGNSYYNCGSKSKAQNAWTKSLSIRENSDAYFALAHFYHYDELNFDSAIYYYKKCIDLEPYPEALNGLGWLQYDLKKFKEAESYLLTLLQLEKMEGYKQLITFYILTNQLEEADLKIKKFRESEGNNFYYDGFKIVLDVVKSKEWSKTHSALIADFERKYGEVEKIWLSNLFHQIEAR
jgi:hypothetical protein